MSNATIVNDFIAAWGAKDIDRIMAAFADGAVYHNIPMDRLVGHEAIRAFIAPFLGMAERITFETHHQAENADGVVLNERTDTFHLKNGKTIAIRVMGVFEFEGGKIARWRDYFDMAEFQKQTDEVAFLCPSNPAMRRQKVSSPSALGLPNKARGGPS